MMLIPKHFFRDVVDRAIRELTTFGLSQTDVDRLALQMKFDVFDLAIPAHDPKRIADDFASGYVVAAPPPLPRRNAPIRR
jgi:hypothetical protein